jgi:hypothetical protein
MTDRSLAPGQWTRARAVAWAAMHPWYCGFNFLPSSAVNFVEMWRAETFDPPTIARELGWAADLGLNALRTNLPFVIWRRDRDGLLSRVDTLLALAAARGLATVLCPFDDCGFGGDEPVAGPQRDPVPGIHNSRAVASPGRATVADRRAWPELERYVRDLVGAFGRDHRLLMWDLYNEPGNGMVFSRDGYIDVSVKLEPHSHALMVKTFAWARAEAPVQPLTVGAWRTPLQGSGLDFYDSAVDSDALALSDVLSFHAYLPTHRTERIIDMLAARERPVFCTEWMARAVESRIGDQLELMRRRDVGCFHWGLVRGRTQTDLPWPEKLLRTVGGVPGPTGWFHDLLEPDGSPHDPKEIEMIRGLGTVPAPLAS